MPEMAKKNKYLSIVHTIYGYRLPCGLQTIMPDHLQRPSYSIAKVQQ